MHALELAGPMLFLSTLSLRRATGQYCESTERAFISIHALLAESDMFTGILPHDGRNFYPRSPCGERPVLIRDGFLIDDISIHALLAESDQPGYLFLIHLKHSISIHALLAESDLKHS